MASIEITAPPQAATTETQITSWSSKLKRYVSRTAAVAVRNQGKVDVTLRLFLFVFSLTGVVVMATSKQTKEIRVSPVMTIDMDAKFNYVPSFTYLIASFSVIWLYSIITGYSSYSALKKQERTSINRQLLFVLLDSQQELQEE
ncbi:hypothetical protein M8C21_000331 [Ambrosia artemisiifolia]|uniref:CASP-like protein n=1 Tax=Ambrosia artemisiifolia TaxID=4212 RepID=A0AAD5CVC5_AMBAR|nr:hypothetical protein M8C21_000331 [Ambrosia artemisiifolia]